MHVENNCANTLYLQYAVQCQGAMSSLHEEMLVTVSFNYLSICLIVCYVLMVNGNTFRGSNSALFILSSLYFRDQLFKKRICSSWRKFFLLKVDPILVGLCHLGKKLQASLSLQHLHMP